MGRGFGKIEYVNVGPGEVKDVRQKAVKLLLSDGEDHWFPLSTLSTSTAAECVEGNIIDRVRVEKWKAEQAEVEIHEGE